MLDSTILLFLAQEGLTNGAIYALLGIALVLVFAVTRVIFIPQGEFVAYGALTFALLDVARMPGTVYLLMLLGVIAFLFDLYGQFRQFNALRLAQQVFFDLLVPVAVYGIVSLAVAHNTGPAVNFLITLAIIAPMGPYIYRIAYQPMADASVLTLLIASVGTHLAMVGMGLVFFGPEGLKANALWDATYTVGPLLVTGQSLAVYAITLILIVGLYLYFEFMLMGKALRATAVNRIGARLVGIRTALSGRVAFALASIIGAVSGILIVPITTIYYDSGFLIGLKGFVAAILAGLGSYPLTALAALFVGMVESVSAFEASNYKEVIVFTLIIPVLLWRSLSSTHVEDEEH